jgi:hypothetical protein
VTPGVESNGKGYRLPMFQTANCWFANTSVEFPFVKLWATLAPDFVADRMCMRNCRDCRIASNVRDGLRMLKVIIGVGVRVTVVKDDTVMPLKFEVEEAAGPPVLVVATTAAWGILRISCRRWDDRAGSSSEPALFTCCFLLELLNPRA